MWIASDDFGRGRLALLAWLIAGTSVVFALAVWLGGPSQRRESVMRASPDRAEAGRLRVALATAEAENATLREELDRLLARLDSTRASFVPPSLAASPAPEESARADALPERLRDLAEQYRGALSRAVRGDDAAADEAYRAAMELIRSGPAAVAAIRDAYAAETDPKVRAVLVRALISSRGEEVEDFVATALISERDPEVREELAVRASRLSTSESAPRFRDAFLEILASEGDAEIKAAAVRGLRSLRTDAQVDRALLVASSDAAEEVRLAAIEILATRPDLRGDLVSILEAETDSRIRTIGNCRLVLAGDFESAPESRH